MTLGSILGALRRNWSMAALGLLFTVAVLSGVLRTAPTYWAQVDVVFLAPASAANPNVLKVESRSLTATAGLIEREVNKGREKPAVSSSSVSLVGEGVRDGYSIRLPNSGGQWAYNFERPVLDVQVTGPDVADVRRRTTAAVDLIADTLRDRQLADGVAEENMITVETAPATAVVYEFAGDSRRAGVVVLALGTFLTVWLVTLWDRWSLRRLNRLRPPRTEAQGPRPVLAPVEVMP
ncbi:hypothetical protein AGMMS50218_09900 [Actinomycetota bacterium]|nr:hypothetical protein AGMMS50218_09900 [Actinomycetota bacterium]